MLQFVHLVVVKFVFVSFYLDDDLGGARLPCVHLHGRVFCEVYLSLEQVPKDLTEGRAGSAHLEGHGGIERHKELSVPLLEITVQNLLHAVELVTDGEVTFGHAERAVTDLVHLTEIPNSKQHVSYLVLRLNRDRLTGRVDVRLL